MKDRTREFGDFQTPLELALEVSFRVRESGIRPKSIWEPTCGKGHFLSAALRVFPETGFLWGTEIHPPYVQEAREMLYGKEREGKVRIDLRDFFNLDFETVQKRLREPILVLGNPPWVTNSTLGTLQGRNLPKKSNIHSLRGWDAISGKSNFDISEWMILHLANLLREKDAMIAFLCKTSVARKVLQRLWTTKSEDREFLSRSAPIESGVLCSSGSSYAARLRRENEAENPAPFSRCSEFQICSVDSRAWFGAAVDSCLFLLRFMKGSQTPDFHCEVFENLQSRSPSRKIGFQNGVLLSDVSGFEKHRLLWKLPQKKSVFRWRSGVKHDCAKVMELIPVSPQQENLSQDVPRRFTNGFGEEWELEPDRVFPMLKSSDVAKSPFIVRKWMLLPQSRPGEDTADLKERFPKTWKYLCAHEGILKRRKSSVYRNGPDFAVFGIGDYTFAPWKVVISGLYKTMRFALIGPRGQKPVVFDDTCNFLGFPSEQQAAKVHRILASEAVREFLQSFVFPDSKRPFTIQVLQQLNLETLLRLDDDISFMERRAWEP